MKYLITIISLIATLVSAKTVEIPVTVPINYDLVTIDHVTTNWSMDIEFTGVRGYAMTNVAPNARSERFVMSFNNTQFTDAQMRAILGSEYDGFVAAIIDYGLTTAVNPVKELLLDAVIGSISQ